MQGHLLALCLLKELTCVVFSRRAKREHISVPLLMDMTSYLSYVLRLHSAVDDIYILPFKLLGKLCVIVDHTYAYSIQL